VPPKSLNWTHRNHQRIGVALADSPAGPWTRFDHPVVDISADHDAPDALMTSNPAACVRPDGGMLMVYKAVATKGKAPFGGPVVHLVATADKPEGPWKKNLTPIFTKPGEHFAAEDPFIWHDGDRYRGIVKDNNGIFTGRGYSLAHWESRDGFDWRPAKHVFVTTPEIVWTDGAKKKLNALERPQLQRRDPAPPAVIRGRTLSRPPALREAVRFPAAESPLGSTHRPGNSSMRGISGTPVSPPLSWLTTRSTALAATRSKQSSIPPIFVFAGTQFRPTTGMPAGGATPIAFIRSMMFSPLTTSASARLAFRR